MFVVTVSSVVPAAFLNTTVWFKLVSTGILTLSKFPSTTAGIYILVFVCNSLLELVGFALSIKYPYPLKAVNCVNTLVVCATPFIV